MGIDEVLHDRGHSANDHIVEASVLNEEFYRRLGTGALLYLIEKIRDFPFSRG